MAEPAAGTTFLAVMEGAAQGFEVLAVVLLVLGLAWSLVSAAGVWLRTREGHRAYLVLRSSFGGTLLLGVEVLVAADLIRTIAVAPTLENVAVLGLVVVIRTFLSFSLEVEIEGIPPWRRALLGSGVRRVPGRGRAAGGEDGAGHTNGP